jgi:hypothetical protein
MALPAGLWTFTLETYRPPIDDGWCSWPCSGLVSRAPTHDMRDPGRAALCSAARPDSGAWQQALGQSCVWCRSAGGLWGVAGLAVPVCSGVAPRRAPLGEGLHSGAPADVQGPLARVRAAYCVLCLILHIRDVGQGVGGHRRGTHCAAAGARRPRCACRYERVRGSGGTALARVGAAMPGLDPGRAGPPRPPPPHSATVQALQTLPTHTTTCQPPTRAEPQASTLQLPSGRSPFLRRGQMIPKTGT